jgi:hypothetical protein
MVKGRILAVQPLLGKAANPRIPRTGKRIRARRPVVTRPL